jgi:hypothetical protein
VTLPHLKLPIRIVRHSQLTQGSALRRQHQDDGLWISLGRHPPACCTISPAVGPARRLRGCDEPPLLRRPTPCADLWAEKAALSPRRLGSTRLRLSRSRRAAEQALRTGLRKVEHLTSDSPRAPLPAHGLSASDVELQDARRVQQPQAGAQHRCPASRWPRSSRRKARAVQSLRWAELELGGEICGRAEAPWAGAQQEGASRCVSAGAGAVRPAAPGSCGSASAAPRPALNSKEMAAAEPLRSRRCMMVSTYREHVNVRGLALLECCRLDARLLPPCAAAASTPSRRSTPFMRWHQSADAACSAGTASVHDRPWVQGAGAGPAREAQAWEDALAACMLAATPLWRPPTEASSGEGQPRKGRCRAACEHVLRPICRAGRLLVLPTCALPPQRARHISASAQVLQGRGASLRTRSCVAPRLPRCCAAGARRSTRRPHPFLTRTRTRLAAAPRTDCRPARGRSVPSRCTVRL